MDYSSLKTQNLERIAKQVHRNFVDSMYPYFNCPRHPGYFDVEVQPMFLLDGISATNWELTNGGILIVKDISHKKVPSQKDYERFVVTIAHESAHLLHPLSWKFAKDFQLGVRKNENSRTEVQFLDALADYASLFFFKNFCPELYDFSRRDIRSGFALKLFDRNPNLLPELAIQKPKGISKFLLKNIHKS